MANWHAALLDVKGAFLHGVFDKRTTINLQVPEGFEKHNGIDVVPLIEGSRLCTLVHSGAYLCRYEIHQQQSRSLPLLCLDCIYICYMAEMG
jgi:hypothetical protein